MTDTTDQQAVTVAHDITRNPASIWLSPICDDTAHHGEGRTWAAPNPDETCEDCSEPWVQYVRSDLASVSSASVETLALQAIKVVTATAKDGAAGLSRIMAIANAAGVQASYSDLLQDLAVALIVERPRAEWAHLFKPDAKGCAIPPEGWQCSRARGHAGPCAASPEPVPATNQAGEVEDERKTDAWNEFFDAHLTDGNDGYSPASVVQRCREAFEAAWHRGWEAAFAAAFAALATQPATSQEGATLYREVDALGGVAATEHERGYVAAIGDVLAVMAKRGFSEVADAASMTGKAPKPLTVRELGEYGRYIHGADYFDNSIEAVEQRRARFTELNDRYLATSAATQPTTSLEAARGDFGVGQNELVAGIKSALQHPAGNHDGWTDTGMENAFFRWPVIVNALNEALAATPTPPTLSEDLRAALSDQLDDVDDRLRNGALACSVMLGKPQAEWFRAALARAQVKAS